MIEMLASEDGQSDEADERDGWPRTLVTGGARGAAGAKKSGDQKGAPAASSS